ncbi:MAG: C4-dicarboxylate ABC transporter permease [Rhodospirillaceae bacterium]|nr:C4-dicarboxylate ABC transporter permease [Rhodospirillaceae bacterium]|tara:strand:+ start:38 stop:556 length:519 start_codon:yes stop_codon:yes gene_type:complete
MLAARWFYLKLLELGGLLAALAYGLIALFVTIEVAIRNLGIGSMLWLTEVIEYSLFVATFVAAPWVLNKAAHVRVDLLPLALPARGRRVLECVVDSLGFTISLFFCWYGVGVAYDAYDTGIVVYNQLAVPEWWLFLPVPFAGALLAIEFVLRFVRSLTISVPEGARGPQDGF